ncbi:class I adenylate-forming enzyme family protein [Tianweitania sediminis]|nr:AMP-binding protein [Tianweitania sediminis]
MSQAVSEAFKARCIQADINVNLHAVIEEAARTHPDGVAWHFIADGSEITYVQLAAATRSVASGLLELGIQAGDRVAVMLPNRPEFPLAWLSIGRIGAVMVPVNVGYTSREVAYVLADSGATNLITTSDLAERLSGDAETRDLLASIALIVVDEGFSRSVRWGDLASTDEALLPEVSPEALVNIQYTSGTTGFPKGCMLTHDYWLVLSAVTAARLNFEAQNVLVAQPFFYMDPQWLLMMAIRVRGTLFVAEKMSTTRFMEWVRRFRIEFCSFPDLLAKAPARPDDRDHSLRHVVVYGLPKQLHAEMEERFGFVAREGYGMTEVGSAIISPFELEDVVGTGSCGIASPFRELSIRDPDGNALPDGQEGELWVRGRSIMQGYWKRPDANAEVFREGGWFRTGDLFRKDADGLYYITGRIKDMIRRSNENIAAREVEAVSLSMAGVKEAAALGVPDEVRGEEVKIYLVTDTAAGADESFVDGYIRHCRQNLAPFKVPRFIELRSELPKTSSDKVAKHVLRSERPDLRTGAFDRVDNLWR